MSRSATQASEGSLSTHRGYSRVLILAVPVAVRFLRYPFESTDFLFKALNHSPVTCTISPRSMLVHHSSALGSQLSSLPLQHLCPSLARCMRQQVSRFLRQARLSQPRRLRFVLAALGLDDLLGGQRLVVVESLVGEIHRLSSFALAR